MDKGTVAVFGFEMIGRKDKSYSRYATEKLTNELVEAGRLSVIERSQIDKLLKEQNFTHSGMVDASMAAKIGKILSVEGVIIGTISVTGSQVELMARVVQSETAVILQSASFRYTIKPYPVPGLGEEKEDKDVVIDGGSEESNTSYGNAVISSKSVYRSKRPITVQYAGLPGNSHDWITLVRANRPDNNYGQWFYTHGKKSGTYRFNGVRKGLYEIRVYYNWPAGGYVVQKRVKIRVK